MYQDRSKKIINCYAYYSHDKIGCGSSSVVFRGTNEITNQKVAIKVISLANGVKLDNICVAQIQLAALKRLKGCSNIIQLKNAFQTKNNVYIITQLCSKGSLQTHLKSVKKIDQKSAIQLMEQLMKGYRSVGTERLIHRDLKPSNIFMSQNQFKIGDFGYAIDANQSNQPSNQNVGSPLYMPLEALKNNSYSYKSDIWALGVIFMEILTGKTPWKSKTERELIQQLSTYQLQNIIPKNLSLKSQKFLRSTLVRDVQKRMSLIEFLNFNFQNDIPDNLTPLILENNRLTKPGNMQIRSNLNLLAQKKVQPDSGVILQIASPRCIVTSPKAKEVFQNVNQSTMLKEERLFLRKKQHNTSLKIEPSKELTSNLTKNVSIICPQEQIKSQNKVVQNKPKLDRPQLSTMPLLKQQNKLQSSRRYIKQIRTDKSPAKSTLKTQQKTDVSEKKQSSQDVLQIVKQALTPRKAKTRYQQTITMCSSLNQRSLSTLNFYSKCKVYQQTRKTATTFYQPKVNFIKLIQSQINYFRFVFKLMKKLDENIKTSDQKINGFKSCLLHLIYSKIEEIKSMKNVKGVSKREKETFMQSKYYENVVKVVNDYQLKYEKQALSSNIKAESRTEKEVIKQVTSLMNIFYQNILKVKHNHHQIARKKMLIFILEDLIELIDAFMLERQQNWQQFHERNKINRYISKEYPLEMTSKYLSEVEIRFFELSKS